MGKGGRCVRLTTLPPSCAVVMKSGNLNFLEPSAPLQACNGTAFGFLLLQASVWTVPSRYFPFQHEHRHHTFQISSSWSGVLVEKMTASQIRATFNTCRYQIHSYPSAHSHPIHFNIVITSMRMSSTRLFPFGFSYQNCMCTFRLRCVRSLSYRP